MESRKEQNEENNVSFSCSLDLSNMDSDETSDSDATSGLQIDVSEAGSSKLSKKVSDCKD